MPISFVGAASGDGTTITIPGTYQAGDLMIIYAFRDATTPPTTAAGWTSLNSATAGASAFRGGWKLAGSASETSGTWTNATGLICLVYRGTATSKVPVLTFAVGTNTGTTISYNTAVLSAPGTNWLIGFAATKTLDSSVETAPAGMTNRTSAVGATAEYAGHDTNAPYQQTGKYPLTTVVIGGTSAEWRTAVYEVQAEQPNLENYKGIDVGDGMATGEKIK